MQVTLVMFRGDGERRSFSITRDSTVIGRREDCDLRIPLSEVSRKHCRLVIEADTLRLEDMGSSNGTFVNAGRIQEVIIQPGDTIQIGPVVFVVQIDGVPADDDLQPRLLADAHMGAMEEPNPMDSVATPTHTDDEPIAGPALEEDDGQFDLSADSSIPNEDEIPMDLIHDFHDESQPHDQSP